MISLDVLPLKAEDLNDGIKLDSCTIRQIRFKLPEKEQATNGTRESWLSAFRSCAKATQRLITIPGHRDRQLGDLVSGSAMLSLLSSGLPLPKSPSMQQAEFHDGQPQDIAQLEREQRGWWSLRFHQVLQEFLSQDPALAL